MTRKWLHDMRELAKEYGFEDAGFTGTGRMMFVHPDTGSVVIAPAKAIPGGHAFDNLEKEFKHGSRSLLETEVEED